MTRKDCTVLEVEEAALFNALQTVVQAYFDAGFDESAVLDALAEITELEPNPEYKRAGKIIRKCADDVMAELS